MILAYLSKNLTNHSLIFHSFGRKIQILVKFWEKILNVTLNHNAKFLENTFKFNKNWKVFRDFFLLPYSLKSIWVYVCVTVVITTNFPGPRNSCPAFLSCAYVILFFSYINPFLLSAYARVFISRNYYLDMYSLCVHVGGSCPINVLNIGNDFSIELHSNFS